MMKSTFLQVMGIISIVFGAIAVIITLAGLAATKMLESLTGVSFTGAIVVEVIAAVVLLVAGILGVVFCTKPENAMVCRILAVVLIVLKLVDFFMTNALYKSIDASYLSGQTGVSPISLILGLIVPVLYLIATFCYKPKN